MEGSEWTKDGHTYGRCARVEAVLDEFLHGRLEINDDLARGDAVDRMCVDRADGGLAHVSRHRFL